MLTCRSHDARNERAFLGTDEHVAGAGSSSREDLAVPGAIRAAGADAELL